ncbi:G-protein alpha subunit [Auriscalpium vulgare]|uniref:G-protein alpha subunit n=1 Tax=Auriscalpium vulgare TaxID=40419 RepID=A0ACB8RQL1_9AGAM|nr:G-protein alpha subunit [Auriscalpium vulgare]
MAAVQLLSTFATAASSASPTTPKRVGLARHAAAPYLLARQYFAGNALARRARARSTQIDAQINQQAVSVKRECKILVLGTEGSGKSTIVRQMRLHEPKGISPDDRLAARSAVVAHLLDSAHAVLDALEKLDLQFVDPGNADNADFVRGYVLDAEDKLNSDIAEAIRSLWHDVVVATLMGRSGEFRLVDNATYFLEAAGRIGADDYVPTDEDMLKARAPVGTVSQTQLQLDGMSIHLLEVGMQKSTKSRWIQAFDDITSIVFCASLGDYDAQATGTTRKALDESLVLFEDTVNSSWFQHTSVILLLTKLDLFEAKLATVPLKKYASDYDDGADVGAAMKYILRQYMNRNRANLLVYPVPVEATDPTATVCRRITLTVVKDTILQSALRTSGILC